MFMFIQTVSVVRRNFIPWRGGEGGETIIKSKLARKRRTRTMGQGVVATPPRRVSDDTRRRRRRRREGAEEGPRTRSFGIRGA